MELNGLIVVVVILGTIGHVLFPCLNKTQTLHSHSCVETTGVRSDLFKRDTPTPAEASKTHQARRLNHSDFFILRAMVKQKQGKKKVHKRKEHKIKWNPKSAHLGEKLQQWTEEDMVRAQKMFQEGKLSQREISRCTGIHVATLNKRFRGLVKGTGHRLGGKQAPKVLTKGT